MARPRKPTSLKLLQGTIRKCRENPNEPEPVTGRPVAPDYLSDIAKEHFETLTGRIEEMNYASPSFTEVLALAASEFDEIHICNGIIDRLGLIVESDVGIKENPAVATRRKAKQGYRMCLSALGLTPSDASKVSAKRKDPEKKSKWNI